MEIKILLTLLIVLLPGFLFQSTLRDRMEIFLFLDGRFIVLPGITKTYARMAFPANCIFYKIHRSFLLLILLSPLIVSVASCHHTSETFTSTPKRSTCPKPHIPFPAHKKYAPGTLKPNHISQQQQDDLVRIAYDDWKKSYLLPEPGQQGTAQMYRVSAGTKRKSKSYSEGQGYGMMLAAYMAGYDQKAQDVFDGLWLFAKKHPSRIDKRFMAYQVPVGKSRRDSAFDGDCDIALALLLADSQWRSDGHINYRQESLSIIAALLEKVIGSDSRLPMLGDWVEPTGKRYNQYAFRSSDIMPSHFKLFYKVTGDKQWQKVTQQSQTIVEQMQTKYSPQTGLLPDFIVGSSARDHNYRPADSWFLESIYDGEYFYNATRVPWRIGVDALLNNDPISQQQVKRIAHWIVKKSGGKASNIGPGYRLNGKRLDNETYISNAFIAPFGVAAMATDDYQDFVNNVFDLCVKLRQDYYEDTIGLLVLLLMTGNCWLPS